MTDCEVIPDSQENEVEFSDAEFYAYPPPPVRPLLTSSPLEISSSPSFVLPSAPQEAIIPLPMKPPIIIQPPHELSTISQFMTPTEVSSVSLRENSAIYGSSAISAFSSTTSVPVSPVAVAVPEESESAAKTKPDSKRPRPRPRPAFAGTARSASPVKSVGGLSREETFPVSIFEGIVGEREEGGGQRKDEVENLSARTRRPTFFEIDDDDKGSGDGGCVVGEEGSCAGKGKGDSSQVVAGDAQQSGMTAGGEASTGSQGTSKKPLMRENGDRENKKMNVKHKSKKTKARSQEHECFKSREFIDSSGDELSLGDGDGVGDAPPTNIITGSTMAQGAIPLDVGITEEEIPAIKKASKKTSKKRKVAERAEYENVQQPKKKKQKRIAQMDPAVPKESQLADSFCGANAGIARQEIVEVNVEKLAGELSKKKSKKRKMMDNVERDIVKDLELALISGSQPLQKKEKKAAKAPDPEMSYPITIHDENDKVRMKKTKGGRRIIEDDDDDESGMLDGRKDEENVPARKSQQGSLRTTSAGKENVAPVLVQPEVTAPGSPTRSKAILKSYPQPPKNRPLSVILQRINGSYARPRASPSVSRTLLTRIVPLHPNRRTPPPPPPRVVPKKTKKEIEREETWEEELQESVPGWCELEEGERERMRREKRDWELGLYEE